MRLSGYRYGVNGVERDDELKGSGNSYDFGARIYNSRLGRWLSLVKHNHLSHHFFESANSPNVFKDDDANSENRTN